MSEKRSAFLLFVNTAPGDPLDDLGGNGSIGLITGQLRVGGILMDKLFGAGLGVIADPLAISYTINWRGEGVEGTFNPDTKAFMPRGSVSHRRPFCRYLRRRERRPPASRLRGTLCT